MLSASSLFRSLKTPLTKDQIAVQLAEDAIEEYRMERMAARMAAGSDAPETAHGMQLLQRLAALMKGPHGHAVKPVVFKAFPELEPPKGTA